MLQSNGNGRIEFGDRRTRNTSAQVEAAKKRICEAVIWCLDKYGFAETSVSKITDRAQISRGALTHHYKSKEDLFVDAVDFVLGSRAKQPWPQSRRSRKPVTLERRSILESNLTWGWQRLDSQNGHALIEVLLACRTDKQLRARVAERMNTWNQSSRLLILSMDRIKIQNREEALLLWDLCRVFNRGLVVHKSMEDKPGQIDRIAKRFIELVSAEFFSSGALSED